MFGQSACFTNLATWLAVPWPSLEEATVPSKTRAGRQGERRKSITNGKTFEKSRSRAATWARLQGPRATSCRRPPHRGPAKSMKKPVLARMKNRNDKRSHRAEAKSVGGWAVPGRRLEAKFKESTRTAFPSPPFSFRPEEVPSPTT